MEDFHILRDRVTKGIATPEERVAYFRKLTSGHYDHLIEDDLDTSLQQKPPPQLQRSRDKILERITNNYVTPLTSARRRLNSVASAVLVFAVIGLGIWLLGIPKTSDFSDAPHRYQTANNRRFIELPDGSSVILNDSTALNYTDTPNGRHAELDGEAYFDISHDPRRPFTIKTAKIVTTVLGTTFNIKAYPGDSMIRVSVTSGKVTVGDSNHALSTLNALDEIAIDAETFQLIHTNQKITNSLAWTTNIFTLHDLDLDEAARKIEQRYHVTVLFTDNRLKKKGIHGTFVNDESLIDMLELVTAAVGCEYEIKGDTVVLIGPGRVSQ